MFLAHVGSPYARDISDSIFSRMQAACSREIYWEEVSRTSRQPVCARYFGQQSFAQEGSLSDNIFLRKQAARIFEIFRTTILRARRQPVRQHFFAQAGRPYFRDIWDNNPSRMRAACIREICRTSFPPTYWLCPLCSSSQTPRGLQSQLRLGKDDLYLSLSEIRTGELSTTTTTSTMSSTSISNPRRNPTRSARPTTCTDELWYPNIKNPESDVDRQIQTLNGEAYPADIFGRVDDLLMFTLFATKQAKRPRKRRHHAVIPEQASDRPMTLTIEEGAEAAQICGHLLSGKEASMDEVRRVASELQSKIPPFRSPEQAAWAPCLRQCVHFLLDFEGRREFASEPTQVCFTGTPLFIRREVRSRSARSHIKPTPCHSA